MKIIIAGNLGYIGPSVTQQLRKSFPDAELIGFDIGYFAHCLANAPHVPEVFLNSQVYGDIRKFPEKLLDGVDAIVDLAAISNDPMGNKYEQVTMDVNYKAAVDLARLAKKHGVKKFVYASSCSMYGAASDYPKKEDDTLNPLTAYARSKVAAEKDLQPLADDNFMVTCLRFATACGFTNRLRLDLVLNDFVASALVSKEIVILSDGTPWRPMINTRDMARAFEWGIVRQKDKGGNFLAVNTGSNEWNVQIKPLAEAVAKLIPGINVNVNQDAAPDKRSYRVNFDLFKKLAPDHQPVWNLEKTITELKSNFLEMNFNDPNFRESKMIRLKVLNGLQQKNLINENLEWNT
ncbi:MAG TPA: NAD(P)-dependent oxidoreductase [Bacteroidales bacterium]|nr:NAD(P)-dependent oxidoreductase [Bacteroidales bacterium]